MHILNQVGNIISLLELQSRTIKSVGNVSNKKEVYFHEIHEDLLEDMFVLHTHTPKSLKTSCTIVATKIHQ